MAASDKIIFKPSVEFLRYYIYENNKFMKGTMDNPYIWTCPDWFDSSDSIEPLTPQIQGSVSTFGWWVASVLNMGESGQIYTLQFYIYDIIIPTDHSANSIKITILRIKK